VGVDPAEFAESVWSRRPLLSRRESRGSDTSYDDLLSLAAVDELLSRRGLRTPFIRIAKGGQVVPPARYTGRGGTGAQVGDQVADDRVLELFLGGHTIVLQGLHRIWPPLIDFAGALRTELGHPVQVNAYITPASNQGFAAHYDVHDVFVLQVAGTKRWRVHAPVVNDPLRDQQWSDRAAEVAARAAEAPLIDEELRPGDALYLPRGYLHSAVARAEVAAHLTVGVHPVTRADVLDVLTELVADDPRLRRSLPLGVDVASPADIATDVDQTIDALTSRLRAVTAREVADRLSKARLDTARPAPLGPLAAARDHDGLHLDSLLVPRAHVVADISVSDTDVLVSLPGRTVTLPAQTAKAVAVAVAGPVRVRDLPGLRVDAALDLARRLVGTGVVTVDRPQPGADQPDADQPDAVEPDAGPGRW
jgi:bifunctional lysine-specific demethylase and histidyl-hydroxylase NO66